MNPLTQLSSVNLIALVIHSVFDLAPSISTSKVCGVSFPYLIYIAGLALSDLIGLTRLSWVTLLVLPNQCGEWALAPALYLYYITDSLICQGVFDNFFILFGGFGTIRR